MTLSQKVGLSSLVVAAVTGVATLVLWGKMWEVPKTVQYFTPQGIETTIRKDEYSWRKPAMAATGGVTAASLMIMGCALRAYTNPSTREYS